MDDCCTKCKVPSQRSFERKAGWPFFSKYVGESISGNTVNNTQDISVYSLEGSFARRQVGSEIMVYHDHGSHVRPASISDKDLLIAADAAVCSGSCARHTHC